MNSKLQRVGSVVAFLVGGAAVAMAPNCYRCDCRQGPLFEAEGECIVAIPYENEFGVWRTARLEADVGVADGTLVMSYETDGGEVTVTYDRSP